MSFSLQCNGNTVAVGFATEGAAQAERDRRVEAIAAELKRRPRRVHDGSLPPGADPNAWKIVQE